MKRETLTEMGYEDLVLLDPSYLDDAIIGVSHDNRAIYDYDKLIETFASNDGMTNEEAEEWIDYNTIRSLPYQQNNPIIMYNFKDF